VQWGTSELLAAQWNPSKNIVSIGEDTAARGGDTESDAASLVAM
jgi:hypothetical protein